MKHKKLMKIVAFILSAMLCVVVIPDNYALAGTAYSEYAEVQTVGDMQLADRADTLDVSATAIATTSDPAMGISLVTLLFGSALAIYLARCMRD